MQWVVLQAMGGFQDPNTFNQVTSANVQVPIRQVINTQGNTNGMTRRPLDQVTCFKVTGSIFLYISSVRFLVIL